ncbi:MAG: aminoglycoside phosphotransferase family protein [Propioniciclava sp.]
MADDGSGLLASAEVGALLAAAVEHGGGKLLAWSLDHVDAHPRRSTTATYQATVEWPFGSREELVGVSARAAGLTEVDTRAEVFADGEREVAVWLYPNDPDLPGLPRAAYESQIAEVLAAAGVTASGDGVHTLDMLTYRPRRRAVVKVTTPQGSVIYVKVLRPRTLAGIRDRHEILRRAGIPAPEVAATTNDGLLLLHALPGIPLAQAIFSEPVPCTAEEIVAVLDAMPKAVTRLERRPPWAASVEHYAGIVAAALPAEEDRLADLTSQILLGLSRFPPGEEATHGDFHEGQVHVAGQRIVGVLDIDTIGPGRRADDLACLIAHLSTIQRMRPDQAARVHDLLQRWVPVFDLRVDPVELRLRTAAVIISLATGPYRGQEPDWERETVAMLDAAAALVRQVS